MAVNVKLGDNTISGVETIKVPDADNQGSYITFKIDGLDKSLYININQEMAFSEEE